MSGDGLRGMDRTPRADTRVRRNAQQLSGSADFLFSGALTVDGDGYIVLVLASGSGLSQSTAGLLVDDTVYLPYTGATTDVNLGTSYTITAANFYGKPAADATPTSMIFQNAAGDNKQGVKYEADIDRLSLMYNDFASRALSVLSTGYIEVSGFYGDIYCYGQSGENLDWTFQPAHDDYDCCLIYKNAAGANKAGLQYDPTTNTLYVVVGAFDVNAITISSTGDITLNGDLLTTGLGTFGTVNLTTNTALLQSDGTTLLADDGTDNLFLGADAFNNDSGLYNVGVGYQAGYNNSNTAGNEGQHNTFIGYKSGYGVTSGIKNTGYFNLAIGSSTLYSNTTGYYNVAIGVAALYSNTIGYYNIAIGASALYYNTTGYQNSAMGALALLDNTTGHHNSAIGSLALRYNTTGYNNVAMGSLALYQNNTTGYYNSAMGSAALRYNATGYYNSAMGAFALCLNTTGYDNSAMGSQALRNLQPTSKAITVFADNGDSKTRVTSAGHGQSNGTLVQISGTTNYEGSWTIEQVATDTFVIDKTFVANDATGWWGIVTEGRRNIAIGAWAGYRQTTVSNRLFIDSRVRANAAQELTNAIIYGVMAALPADQDLYLNADVFLMADNRPIYFGAANDADIYYDGTDLYIDSQQVGNGHIILNSPKTTTGDPTGVEGKIYWNTVDNVIKMYADGAWRILASW